MRPSRKGRSFYRPDPYCGGPIPSPVFPPEHIWRFIRWARLSDATAILAGVIDGTKQHIRSLGKSGRKPLTDEICRQLSWLWWGLHKGAFHISRGKQNKVELLEGPGERTPYELDLPLPQPEVQMRLHARAPEHPEMPQVPIAARPLGAAARRYREIRGGHRPGIAHDRHAIRAFRPPKR